MHSRIGTYLLQKIPGESYHAYVPPKLPPDPPIDLAFLYPHLEKATQALAALNNLHRTIPNTALFIYMQDLFEQDAGKIARLGRARISCEPVWAYLKHLPQVTVPLLAHALGITAPTARNANNHLVALGIVEEISGKKRDRIYVYRAYLDLLEDGETPFWPEQ